MTLMHENGKIAIFGKKLWIKTGISLGNHFTATYNYNELIRLLLFPVWVQGERETNTTNISTVS